MSPTLADGDLVLLNRGGRPRPGAVVVVSWPQRPGRLSVKRVVGRHGATWWVQGDNPHASTDSRHLGPAHVLAVVPARLYPNPTWLPALSGLSGVTRNR